jgi:hypothetical protein
MYVCQLVNMFDLKREERPQGPQTGEASRFERPWCNPSGLNKHIMEFLHDLGLTWEGLRMKIAYKLLEKMWEYRGLRQGNYVAYIHLRDCFDTGGRIATHLWSITQLFVVVNIPDKRLYRTILTDRFHRELIPGPQKENKDTESLYRNLMRMYKGDSSERCLEERCQEHSDLPVCQPLERQIYKYLVRAMLQLQGAGNEHEEIDLHLWGSTPSRIKMVTTLLEAVSQILPTKRASYRSPAAQVALIQEQGRSFQNECSRNPQRSILKHQEHFEQKVHWKNKNEQLCDEYLDKELMSIRGTFCKTLGDMIQRLNGITTGNYILRFVPNQETQQKLEEGLKTIWNLFEYNSPPVCLGLPNKALESYHYLFRITTPCFSNGLMITNRMYLEAYEWFNKELGRLNLTMELMGAMSPTYLAPRSDDVSDTQEDLLREGQTTRTTRFVNMVKHRLETCKARETEESIKALRLELQRQKVDVLKAEFIVQTAGLLQEELKGLKGPERQNGYFWEALFS